MCGCYVTALVLMSILQIQLSSSDLLEQDSIVLTHSMSGSTPRELTGKVGQHLRYSILMPTGFQSYLVIWKANCIWIDPIIKFDKVNKVLIFYTYFFNKSAFYYEVKLYNNTWVN